MNCHGSINMSSHSISLQKLHWVFPVGKIRILCHHIHTLSLYSTMNMDITKVQWHLGNYKYSFNKIRKKIYSASEKNVRASREATQWPRETLRL